MAKLQFELLQPNRRIYIRFQGTEYSVQGLSKKLGVPATTVYHALKKSHCNADVFTDHMKDVLYRMHNGLNKEATIYRRDNLAYTVPQLMNRIKIGAGSARERLKQWAAGEKSWEDVISPVSEERQRAITAATETGEKFANLPSTPRKSVADLPTPGSWEREQMRKQQSA